MPRFSFTTALSISVFYSSRFYAVTQTIDRDFAYWNHVWARLWNTIKIMEILTKYVCLFSKQLQFFLLFCCNIPFPLGYVARCASKYRQQSEELTVKNSANRKACLLKTMKRRITLEVLNTAGDVNRSFQNDEKVFVSTETLWNVSRESGPKLKKPLLTVKLKNDS